MKLSDYIVQFLVEQKIKHCFILTGGACAHITDSLHKHHHIHYIPVLHEQAGAMAAEAYTRVTRNLGAMVVTSGPGATNLLTGICCAWFDSIPTLFISGQVNTFESKSQLKVRQVGFQETDIVDIARSVTKYAVQVKNPKLIRFELEKAVFLAKSGRPGPVLVDIPMDVQRADIHPAKIKKFIPPPRKPYRDTAGLLDKKVTQTIRLLRYAQRPVLLVGGGIRLAQATPAVHTLATKLKIPLVCTWSGFDVFWFNHPRFVGQMGVYGNRAANFTVQNADVLLSLGSRLDTRITGGKPETYARQAKKIVVDIDAAEIRKKRGLNPDVPIHTDVAEFVQTLNQSLPQTIETPDWVSQTQAWKKEYPGTLASWYTRKKFVDPYVFIQTLSRELKSDATIITDCGANLTWTMQAFELKKGQRLFSAFGNSPMGYAFPASIGASIGLNKKPIICITGDGGFQINIQELQTIVAQKLPLKIFILNNHSYGIIKQFQDMYFDKLYAASAPSTGVTVPDFVKVGRAYGLKTATITHHRGLRQKITWVLRQKGAVLCDVVLPDDAQIIPKLEFGKPIEDLGPLLPRKEFFAHLLVPPLPSSRTTKEGV